MTYCFKTRTGQICFDHAICDGCQTHACVEACHRFGADILKLEGGRPVLSVTAEVARRRDTECLGCEVECLLRGQKAIAISLPIAGLEEFRSRHGNPTR